MKYMLDTNIIAYAKNNRPESVLKGTFKNSHHRRAAEFQPSSPCKNLDCPPGSLRLLQVKSD